MKSSKQHVKSEGSSKSMELAPKADVHPPKAHRQVNMTRSSCHPFKSLIPTFFAGNTGTVTYALAINPGDPEILPRLSLLAAAWTSYKFKRLSAKWVPNGSAFAAANQTGQVVVGFNGNWYSADSSSLAMADEKKPSKLCDAWKYGTVHCSQSILSKKRFLRSTFGSAADDMRLSDFLLEVVVSGTPNTANVGWIELEGEVEFSEDYVENTVNASRTNRIFVATALGTQTLTTGVAGVISFDGTPLAVSKRSGVAASTTVFSLAGGTYWCRCKVYLTATSMSQIQLNLSATGTTQAIGSGISNFTGLAAGAFVVEDDVFVSVAEDATSGQVTTSIQVIGTGTITIVGATMTIIPY